MFSTPLEPTTSDVENTPSYCPRVQGGGKYNRKSHGEREVFRPSASYNAGREDYHDKYDDDGGDDENDDGEEDEDAEVTPKGGPPRHNRVSLTQPKSRVATCALTKDFKMEDGLFIYQDTYDEAWNKWYEQASWHQARKRQNPQGKITIPVWSKGKKSAWCWTYFDVVAERGGEPKVRCHFCRQVLQWPGNQNNGNSGMMRHIKSSGCRKKQTERQKRMLENMADGQATGEISVEGELPLMPFSNKNFRDELLKSILALNLSFRSVDNLQLRRLLRMLKPEGLDIPSATTIREHLKAHSAEIRGMIKEELSGEQKISLALDAWSSPNKHAFLSVVAYYITQQWELREILIGFEHISGAHTGDNLAQIVMAILEEMEIGDRLFGINTDNASNNGTLTKAISEALSYLDWDQKTFHVPCLAHVINLAVQDFMKELKIVSEHDEIVRIWDDTPTRVRRVAAMPYGFPKTLAKVRNLAIAINASPQRLEAFMKCQSEPTPKNPRVRMIQDVRTRWNSSMDMLTRALRIRTAINAWVKDHEEFSPLVPTKAEWQQVVYVIAILKPFTSWTEWISQSKSITIHRVFFCYESLFNHLDSQDTKLERKKCPWKRQLIPALNKCRQKLSKYYKNTNSPRGTLYNLGCVLDPSVKLNLYKNKRSWEKEYEGVYRREFEEFIERYYAKHLEVPYELREEEDDFGDLDSDNEIENAIGARVRGFQTGTSAREAIPDLQLGAIPRYLDSPVVPAKTKPLDWWKQNEKYFPEIAPMARDVLAVPAGSVGVERTFSMGRDVISYRRSNLKPQTIADIMVSKHFNRSLLSAALEVDPDAIMEKRGMEEEALAARLDMNYARNRVDISDDEEDDIVDDGHRDTLETEQLDEREERESVADSFEGSSFKRQRAETCQTRDLPGIKRLSKGNDQDGNERGKNREPTGRRGNAVRGKATKPKTIITYPGRKARE